MPKKKASVAIGTWPTPERTLDLALKYRPLLVLYPEIADGSRRKDHHRPGHALGSDPPLEQDYHPRDINLVLDNAYLPGKSRKPTRNQLLKAMSDKANKLDYIHLIDEGGPKDVDKFWRVYADIKDKDSNPKYHRKAYARIVRGSGQLEEYISIQYWLAYFFDDWANVHEMDWEMASVILKESDSSGEEPVACVYNAHIGSFRKPWDKVDKVGNPPNGYLSGEILQKKIGKNDKNDDGSPPTHPVVYVANGSHASYFSDYPPSFNVVEKYLKDQLKTAIRLVGIGIGTDFTDYVPGFEEGVKCFPKVEVIHGPDENGKFQGDWRWLNFKGKWGSPVELTLKERLIPDIPLLRAFFRIFKRPIREAGPPGPNARPDWCWKRPIDWVNLECFDAEESRDWLREHKQDDERLKLVLDKLRELLG